MNCGGWLAPVICSSEQGEEWVLVLIVPWVLDFLVFLILGYSWFVVLDVEPLFHSWSLLWCPSWMIRWSRMKPGELLTFLEWVPTSRQAQPNPIQTRLHTYHTYHGKDPSKKASVQHNNNKTDIERSELVLLFDTCLHFGLWGMNRFCFLLYAADSGELLALT